MTIMPDEWSAAELLADRRQQFDSRMDIGPMSGIFERIARYVGGDPIGYFNVSNAFGSASTKLPNESRARSAVLFVIGSAVFFRTDGSTPASSNEQTLPIGAIVYLFGQPTILGFSFNTASLGTAIVAGNFYD